MKKLYILPLVLFVLLFTSCGDSLEEVNLDPNRQEASEANPGFLFAQAVHLPTYKENFAQQLGYISVQGTFSNYFATMFPGAFPADSYANANDFSDFGFWDVYWKSIPLINKSLELTDVGGEFENANNNAMIRIWKVYVMSRLTDSYGDIPYTEAGIAYEGNITPKYDRQDGIYRDFFNELDQALNDLQVPVDGSFIEQDILFSGNIQNWIKFGNSLRLRLGMRVKYADRELSEQEVLKAVSGDLLSSNDDNVLNYSSTARNNFQHPLYQISTSPASQALKVSKTFVDFLDGTHRFRDNQSVSGVDPRLEVLISQNEFGQYFGIPQGHTSQYYAQRPEWLVEGSYANFHNFSTRNVSIMSFSEVQFLLAEAALEGYAGVSGNASEYFENGIQASMDYLGVFGSDYINDESLLFNGLTSEEARLERIIYQKWVGIFPDTHEAWAEQRRTGYPVVRKRSGVDFSLGLTDGTIPNRIPYPQGERNVNGENVNSAISDQGGDGMLIKVWWDQKSFQDNWE